MVTISLCMIVKNEEYTLGRCLECVKDIVDEINIVDTGSDDSTKKIAARYTKNVFDFEWIDDFAAARNFAFSKATKDYIFWLDADDILLDIDIVKFKHLKSAIDPSIDVVMFKYNLGVDKENDPTCTYYRERLLKRSMGFVWNDPVHEYIAIDGKIVSTDIAVTHKRIHPVTDRNLKIFEKMINDGKALSDRNTFYYARELCSSKRFDDAIIYFNKFLDSQGGLMSNYVDASIDLYSCYKTKSDMKNALRALLRSFEHGTPRAEVCCQIGYYYKNLSDYQTAIFWFKLAAEIEKPVGWGSVLHDCYGYMPNMELCSCYYRTGKIEEALKYNNKAGKFKKGDPMVLHNREFLKGLLSIEKN
jgi:glycosyltransferase involved in cell wall biosynthesis